MRTLALVVLAASAAHSAKVAAQAADRPWVTTARVMTTVRFDDNPFLLTEGRKAQLDQPAAADLQSGRFADMAHATDVVPAPALELELAGPGVGGRELRMQAGVVYDANLRNERRRHTELELTIAQALRRDGRVRLTLDWRPSYFHKNYLRDALDLDADGIIAPDERRYGPGTSQEVDAALGYRHRLLKATGRRPFGLSAELTVGYFSRAYDAPFAGRSRRGPGAGFELAANLGQRWSLDLEYSYEALSADPTREVMLLDETLFGRDFNGNGATGDTAARAFELVDRSRVEHEGALALRGELTEAATLELAYGRRLRDFGSTEPYDIANRGRDDTLHELTAALSVRAARGMHLDLGARRAVQTTNRAGDPAAAGDVADYTRYVAWAGLRYRF